MSNVGKKRSRRKFLIGLAGLGLGAYLLYRLYPDALSFIPNMFSRSVDGNFDGSRTGSRGESQSSGSPIFEGVSVPEPPLNLATPYLRVSGDPSSMFFSGRDVYIKIVNEGNGPSLSGVLEVYRISKLDTAFVGDEWFNGGWIEDASLIYRARFKIHARRRLNLFFRLGDILDSLAYNYVFLVYDEAFDPRDIAIHEGNRKLIYVT